MAAWSTRRRICGFSEHDRSRIVDALRGREQTAVTAASMISDMPDCFFPKHILTVRADVTSTYCKSVRHISVNRTLGVTRSHVAVICCS